MRAFIHAFRGRPWNKECCDAKDGFHKLGIETVMFTTNEEFDLRNPEDVVVGGTVIGIKQGFLQQHVIDRIEILFHHALLKPQEILQCFSWRSCLQEKVGPVDVKSHEVMRIFKAEAAED